MQLTSLPEYTLSANLLQDKTILITGATRGLGRQVALQAAAHGATTILLGSSVKRLERLYDEMLDRNYPEPALQPVNFLGTGPQELEVLTNSVQSLFGKLDGIVHCAATVGQVCPLETMPPQKWLEAVHVNLNIPFLLTHAMLPLLRQSTHAHIIFTADQETQHPMPYWGAYAASKMGLSALAETFAQELESTHIRVNTVYPPNLQSALKVNHYPGLPPECFTPVEDIAAHYVYLLGEHNKNHGQHFSLKTMEILA